MCPAPGADPLPAAMTNNRMDDEVSLAGGGRSIVFRRGGTVFRVAGPWSATVIRLLRHLEDAGFEAAPRVVGPGFDALGRETVSFVEGDFVHPGPWQDAAVVEIGAILRRLHDATASFPVPDDAVWRPWFGRGLGGSHRVLGHCDTGPWNIVARAGLPVALIDWEEAGPVAREIELAQACWLNAQLHDDDIAARVGLGPPEARARQVRLLLDSYGLARAERAGFVETMSAFAVHDAADQAVQAKVTMESTSPAPLWAIAWRTRAASWMLRHRVTLETALDRL